jgi:hypothetical protein
VDGAIRRANRAECDFGYGDRFAARAAEVFEPPF